MTPTAPLGPARTTFAIVALSFGTGVTDAFAFQQLGGIFTANMTGNLILVGLVERPRYAEVALGATVAVATFTLALVAGFGATRPGTAARQGRHPLGEVVGGRREVVTGMVVAQALVLAVWLGLGSRPGLAGRCVLIGLSATAMALQTVLGSRLFAFARITTTFMTGALAALLQDVVDGRRHGWPLRLGAVAALVVGAFTAAGAMVAGADLAPLLSAATSALAAVVLLWPGRGGAGQPGPPGGATRCGPVPGPA